MTKEVLVKWMIKRMKKESETEDKIDAAFEEIQNLKNQIFVMRKGWICKKCGGEAEIGEPHEMHGHYVICKDCGAFICWSGKQHI